MGVAGEYESLDSSLALTLADCDFGGITTLFLYLSFPNCKIKI